ncbi:hypothetical protein QIA36_05670 (plasmid) [Borreliella yangtzensis]|uniref:hypothetical protein n=1 Tax=Borreliella yangtzensis TaxID=683292 RepID=UPI003B21DE4F
MYKLLILIILSFSSCDLNKSDQKNLINILDKKSQKNKYQAGTQFLNEIQAFKSGVNSDDKATYTKGTPYIKTTLKIEKQVDGKIIINEKTKKLLEIKNGDITIMKNSIQYGGSFKAKDIRENQKQKKDNSDIYIDSINEYRYLKMPFLQADTNYFYATYIIKADDLLRIIGNF